MAKAEKSKKSATPKKAAPSKTNDVAKAPVKSTKKDDVEEDGKDAWEEEPSRAKALKATASSKKKTRDDDEDGDEDEVDDWEKPDEEDNWDPDFDEFDLPNSRAKKSGKKDDDDFAIDDEFKDMGMFDDSGGFDDDDDF